MLKDTTIQPFIIAVGEKNKKVNNSYLYFNDIFYDCKNILKAISILFQIFFSLNLQYPTESQQVYYFLEEYFFGLPVSGKKSNAVISLLSDLKN